MKILFLGGMDHANLCNGIARAVNGLVGSRVARVVTVHTHPFGYPEDWIASQGHMVGLDAFAREADWLISTGDGAYGLFEDAIRDLPLRADVKIGVTHAGTAYRQDPAFYNDRDQAIGARVRFVGSDSYHLMGGDPRAVPYFGVYEGAEVELAPLTTPLRVSHSPSTRAKKGTETVLTVFRRVDRMYETDLIEGVSHVEALERRRLAHVHVDQMAPEVGGWGQSAIEAMAVGCAVVADIRRVVGSVYGFFSRPPIEDVRDARELEDWLRLFHDRRDVLEKRRAQSLAWSRAHSTPAAVARYFLGHLERS